MKRTLLLIAVCLAVPLTAAATPLPRLSAEVPQRFAIEHTRARLDLLLMPRGVLDEVVRWQCSFRDLVYDTAGRLAALATLAQVRIPDVSVLSITLGTPRGSVRIAAVAIEVPAEPPRPSTPPSAPAAKASRARCAAPAAASVTASPRSARRLTSSSDEPASAKT